MKRIKSRWRVLQAAALAWAVATVGCAHAPCGDSTTTGAVSASAASDAAVLSWAAQVRQTPRNAGFAARFNAELSDPVGLQAAEFPYRVVFAPGWFYRSHPENGGDFASQRKLLQREGISAQLIETDENGSVEANAEVIADFLRGLDRDGPRAVVVGASKAGPEVALALGSPTAHGLEHVVAWINIGGVVRGSPLADRALAPGRRGLVGIALRAQGFDCAGLESLSTQVRREQFETLQFPPDLLIVNYVAVPLARDVSEQARRTYDQLNAYGPNDGLTLLADSVVEPGVTLLHSGVDHYFRDADLDARTMAMLRTTQTTLAARTARAPIAGGQQGFPHSPLSPTIRAPRNGKEDSLR